MWQYILYAVTFFFVTLLIQSVVHKLLLSNGKKNKSLWTGYQIVVCLCVLGLATGKLYCFASIIGFVVADEIGKKNGWHE